MSDPVCIAVGTTQTGKSALISLLYKTINQSPPESLVIGNSTSSTTETTSAYVIESRDRFFDFNLPTNQPLPPIYEHLKNMNLATQPIPPIKDYSDPHRYTFIDTPGIDDSNGNDERNIMSILDHIKNYQHISCILFTLPFTFKIKTLTKYFEYYYNFIPQLRNNFIIVHTMCDFFLKDISKVIEMRIKAFNEAFHHIITDVLPTHVFVNSIWQQADPRYPRTVRKAQYHEAMAQVSVNRLFRAIRSLQPIHINSLYFLKLPEILNQDKKLIAVIKGMIDGGISAINVLSEKLGKKVDQIKNWNLLISEAKSEIYRKKATLNLLNVDDYVQVGKEDSDPEFKPTSDTTSLKIISPYPLAEAFVTVLLNTNLKNPPQMSMNLEHDQWTVECEVYSSQWCFATLVAHTNLKTKHSQTISDINARIEMLEKHVNTYSDNIKELVKNEEKLQGEINYIIERIDYLSQVLATLERNTLEDHRWRIMKDFYTQTMNYDSVQNFVQYYPDLTFHEYLNKV